MKDLREDRAAIYAAMADEEAGEQPQSFRIDAREGFYTIEQDGRKIELVTAEYARRLVQTVEAQARALQKMERQFARIAATLRDHRQQNNRLNYALGDLSRDLEYKIDRRD